MQLSDKIGLWADEKLSELYWERKPFQALREKMLNLLVPVCGHKDFETGVECKNPGEPCWLPNYSETDEEDAVMWYCGEHMHVEGFCRGCRQLWAGCEDFDFDPHGLCSNCRHDPDYSDRWDTDDAEEWDETDGYYDEPMP